MCVYLYLWGGESERWVEREGGREGGRYECEWLCLLLSTYHMSGSVLSVLNSLFSLIFIMIPKVLSLYVRCSWLLFPNTTTATSTIPCVLLTMWFLTLVLPKGGIFVPSFLICLSWWLWQKSPPVTSQGRSWDVLQLLPASSWLLVLGTWPSCREERQQSMERECIGRWWEQQPPLPAMWVSEPAGNSSPTAKWPTAL